MVTADWRVDSRIRNLQIRLQPTGYRLDTDDEGVSVVELVERNHT